MKFIELDSVTDKKLFVNFDLVTTVEPINTPNSKAQCVIYFASPDDTVKVTNTYDEVKALMWR